MCAGASAEAAGACLQWQLPTRRPAGGGGGKPFPAIASRKSSHQCPSIDLLGPPGAQGQQQHHAGEQDEHEQRRPAHGRSDRRGMHGCLLINKNRLNSTI